MYNLTKQKGNKLKWILLIVAILLIAFLGMKYYQYNILIKVGNSLINVYEGKNYYYETNDITGDLTFPNDKKWIKNNKIAMQTTDNYNKGNTIWYMDTEKDNIYIVSKTTKTYFKMNEDVVQSMFDVGYAFINLPAICSISRSLVAKDIENLNEFYSVLIKMKFENDTYNGEECYKISYKDISYFNITWISKNTFLPTKSIHMFSKDAPIEVAYTIIPNIVEDKDVTFLDIDEYSLIENDEP